MRENEKKVKSEPSTGILAERAATAKLQDQDSAKLRKAAGSVGNEELQKRIEKGSASRDELLRFVVERLQTVRAAQMREMDLTSVNEQRKYWKEVADSHKDLGKPDPTRWRETAKIYEEATYQICRGALGRGMQLVQRAIDQEKKTFDSATRLVNLDDLQTEAEEPDVVETISSEEACAATDIPPEIEELARKIQNVTEEVPNQPVRERTQDPWWTEEEEEEEENGEPDGA